ncbi:ABC transporter permease subunit [Nesterenkonia sp. Act20]|uniref:ABC transporter permease n=1 Tax=Nesterenkonia sp. Act20 TaxID=1483432 RepID=UPI001C46EFFE
MSRRRRPRWRVRTVLPLLLGLALLIWIMLPLVPVLLWSAAGAWRAPDVLPSSWTADAALSLAEPEVLMAGVRSLGLGLSVAVTATVLGGLAAFGLRGPTPGGSPASTRLIGFVMLTPLAVPPFALVMGSNVLLLGARAPSFLGVLIVLTVTALPYTTYMFVTALASYEDRFEAVARTLGASPAQVVLKVRLGLLMPAIARAGFLAFLVGWSDYITTVLIGGGQFITLPLLLGSAASSTGGEQLTAALSLAMIVPPVVLLILLARRGARGRTSS